jgi:hypothetical protein
MHDHAGMLGAFAVGIGDHIYGMTGVRKDLY